MRVLLHSNVIIPCVALASGDQQANSAGWIEAVIDAFTENDEIELGIICPGRTEKSGRSSFGKWWIIPVCGGGQAAIRRFSRNLHLIYYMFLEQNQKSH